jgi:hypothetical protein
MIMFHSVHHYRRRLSGPMAIAALLCVWTTSGNAQQSFSTPEEAANALAVGVKSDDPKDILKVLGFRGADIVSSGDKVADAEARQRFVAAYDVKHSIRLEGDNRGVMILGIDDFPFPIPLIHQKRGWQFDIVAGRLEVLYRRIGRNELDAIQTCLAYVDAQDEYAEKDRTRAGIGVYAQRIVSTSGKKDGLYWQSSDGDQSPLGELAARASAEGYELGSGPVPYHGYYYRILTQQGPNAAGGILNYVVKGKMIGGFALVAYPAVYGNSGVMTFLINQTGTVYQKDLGNLTLNLVTRMSWFDPDQTWKKVNTTDPRRANP